jgi:hypothetical protein
MQVMDIDTTRDPFVFDVVYTLSDEEKSEREVTPDRIRILADATGLPLRRIIPGEVLETGERDEVLPIVVDTKPHIVESTG